ncbi:MAG TPA: exosortase/archaeosortase family protein [Thermoanaerobaculia bacterium]
MASAAVEGTAVPGSAEKAGPEPRAFWGLIGRSPREWLPVVLAIVAFAVLYAQPMSLLVRDWWNDPEAGHGLLLGPLALFLAWKRGLVQPQPQRVLGMVLLVGSVLLRYMSGLAAELFTMRMSMLGAAFGLVIFLYGLAQIRRWWLPIALLLLSVPLPAIVLSSLAFPLQLKASQMGAALLEWRHVPVAVAGNVIHLPGRTLFVTEACSGLRSLTALIALGVLIGGLWLRSPWMRVLLLALTVPVAMILNGIRIFFTGFLVYFVSPGLGEGFMHYTEGWVIFAVAFAILGATAWLLAFGENAWRDRRSAS